MFLLILVTTNTAVTNNPSKSRYLQQQSQPN